MYILLFQFLIGTLETAIFVIIYSLRWGFQFLIGTLETVIIPFYDWFMVGFNSS